MENPWTNHRKIHGKSMGNPWVIKTEKRKCFRGTPWGPHGDPWAPMRNHGFPWEPMGTHGDPCVPMGPHGSPWVPWDPMGSPWGPHGAPMASMENPRMSEIMDFNENHDSVRQKIGDPGSKSIRNVFPVIPVMPKRPESNYGPLSDHFCRKSSFSSFSAYWTLIGPLFCGKLQEGMGQLCG